MTGIITLHGFEGGQVAPVGGCFIPTQQKNIEVTRVISDDAVPLCVRHRLVGLKIATSFDSLLLMGAVPAGTRAAYASKVAQALASAGHVTAAARLRECMREKYPDDREPLIFFAKDECVADD